MLYFSTCSGICAQHHDSTISTTNEYMHQTSHEDLVKIFDSPERDAWQKPEKVIKFLGDIKGKTVVDVGSGSGYFSFRLVNAGAHVIAADVDKDFLDGIKTKSEEAKIDNEKLRTVLIDDDKLNIDKNSADIILLVNVYHHLSNRVPYFAEVNNTLKDSGKIVIVDFYKKSMSIGPPKNHKLAKEVVLQELREARYSKIEVDTTLLEYQYIITAHKF